MVSSRYRSLKARLGAVSKRASPVERRDTVKRNGEAWRVKVRSEVAAERTRLRGEASPPVLASSWTCCRGASRGMTSWGTSHRGWSASVMRTWSRLLVSSLPPVWQISKILKP